MSKRQTQVKLDTKIVEKYRALSKRTMIPMAKMIKRAMEDWLPAWEATAEETTPKHKKYSGG